MGCFDRLSNLKRHFARLRPGRSRRRELNIGEPFEFRKDTNPSHYGLQSDDPFISMNNSFEKREPVMRENLGFHDAATSRQHLTAEVPSSTTSRQPTLCESTTNLPQGNVRWADDA